LTRVSLFVCLMLASLAAANGENLLPPIDDSGPWHTKVWNGEGEFAVTEQAGGDGKCFQIESAPGGDLSWSCPVDVEPGKTYILSGRIKTPDERARDPADRRLRGAYRRQ
jgi:hypothetical protein